MTKIAIVYYSLYGHVATLAESVAEGIKAGGADVDIFQVAETLPEEVLGKMGAPPKKDHPVITADKLKEYDGVMFGISGRYGSYSAQIKTFMDSTGSLWQTGAMVGKAAGVFQSTGTQGGGQETIGLTIVPFFAHHGMVFVPLGYAEPKVFSFDEPHGASPYGSGSFAGPDGSRMPSDLEKDICVSHGKHFATIAAKLAS
ncbi:TrpR binding protein [Nitzschia inconspicua]|uniref:TrpR binding protein n=1 Tax=Nitzschia inconspicua TaxID=303405 RepID=A0A9K3M026_9STRA|nr:TrpR binding protein [Nitzschia inconspicua]